jgi:hypothetical protein
MLIGTIQKDILEKLPISVDFAPFTPTAATVTVIKKSDGGDGSAILNGTKTIVGTKVLQSIHAGTAGESYKIQVVGEITATHHLTGHVRVDVFDY